MGAKKKSRVTMQPYTVEEKVLAQVAALDAGIVPIDLEVMKKGPHNVPRESRRKFRKLWRKCRKMNDVKRDLGLKNDSPRSTERMKRRALVGALMNLEGKKLKGE